MQPAEFDRLVNDAYERIPPRFRRRLKNLAMIVEAEPSAAQLVARAGAARRHAARTL